MPSPLSLICPIGDKYGTVKSHAHNVYPYAFNPDLDTLKTNPIYTEVTREQWALFALNARSMNVTTVFTAGLGPMTLWRASIPKYNGELLFTSYDEEVGRESSPLYLTEGTIPPNLPGVLHFSPLPWVFVGFGINQPNPGTGYRNVYFNPECYILNGKFYIGVDGYAGAVERVEVNGNVFTYFRAPAGQPEYASDVFEITSTFYPTS